MQDYINEVASYKKKVMKVRQVTSDELNFRIRRYRDLLLKD